MTILHSIILGIVEGITEFLPISSTGHLILAGDILNIQPSDFLKSFEIVIQLGAILSVVFLYWKKFLFDRDTLKKIITALIPTLVIGAAFYKIVKTLLGNEAVVLWSLLIGGIILIVFEVFHREKEDADSTHSINSEQASSPQAISDMKDITYKQSLAIGAFQSIAIIPGVSRSAATIVGGLVLGLKRKTIVEFSFLLAVPTMLAASTLDLYKNYQLFSIDQFGILAIGFIVSFVVALLSIKWLLKFIQNHSFIGFGVYRIMAAILFWFFVLR